mmetsp:Transcript_41317/g.95398  ORF Transcript_41317/g.95398 Transcript_41317/m.95398 type:complete len:113 (+) Transcript_41317:1235-1573(+)
MLKPNEPSLYAPTPLLTAEEILSYNVDGGIDALLTKHDSICSSRGMSLRHYPLCVMAKRFGTAAFNARTMYGYDPMASKFSPFFKEQARLDSKPFPRVRRAGTDGEQARELQ